MENMAGLKNVLIVEDETMIRDLYRTILVRAGYSVAIAGSSHEAFAVLQKFRADVVLLDIMLPGMSGIDILKELRTNPVHNCQKNIILLLTNLAQQDFNTVALDNNADGYIVKADILPQDLVRILKSLAEE